MPLTLQDAGSSTPDLVAGAQWDPVTASPQAMPAWLGGAAHRAGQDRPPASSPPGGQDPPVWTPPARVREDDDQPAAEPPALLLGLGVLALLLALRR